MMIKYRASHLHQILFRIIILVVILFSSWCLAETAKQENFEQSSYSPFISIGLPVPISIGISYQHNIHWTGLFDIGYGPIPGVLSNAIEAAHIEVAERWFPKKNGSFFMAFGTGYQTIRYHRELNLGTITGDLGVSRAMIFLNQLYISYEVGWMWQIHSGFALGLNVGLQFPVYGWGGVTMLKDSEGAKSFEQGSRDGLSSYATWVVPRMTLLEARW